MMTHRRDDISQKNERQNPKRRLGWKAAALAAAVIVVVLGVIGGTVAYLATQTKPVENTFLPSEVACKIEEVVSATVKSSVTIKNTGDVPAFIRVAVIGNTLDEEGGIIGGFNPEFTLGAGWVKSGNYYYYTSAVAPNGLTGELLGTSISLTGKQVTILAEAIQAEPVDAVVSAWGVNPSSLSASAN